MARKKVSAQAPATKRGLQYTSVGEFVREYLKNNTFPNYATFNSKVWDVLDDKVKEFDNVIAQKKAELDETPLTRKEYEQRLSNLKKETNIFKEFSELTNNEKSELLFYRYVLHRFEEKKVSDAKALEFVNFLWETLDYRAMFVWFDDYRYEDSVDVEENDSFYTAHNKHDKDGYWDSNKHSYTSYMLEYWIEMLALAGEVPPKKEW